VLAAHPLAYAEERDLIEPLCLRIGEPEDTEVGEVAGQQRDRRIQPLLRDHHQQHATLDQPAKRVLEEEVLHPLVVRGSDLGIVGRVHVEKGKALCLADRVKEVAVDGCDPTGRRGRGAACVQLDAVLFDLCAFSQLMKCCVGAGTGVDSAGARLEVD
jgi:hypothetical protein